MVKVLTMIIVPLLMVATVSTIPVEAKVWYVRPFGGHYGTADGSKYENAFNGFNNLNWGKRRNTVRGYAFCLRYTPANFVYTKE
jgi:hypothetical protein